MNLIKQNFEKHLHLRKKEKILTEFSVSSSFKLNSDHVSLLGLFSSL